MNCLCNFIDGFVGSLCVGSEAYSIYANICCVHVLHKPVKCAA